MATLRLNVDPTGAVRGAQRAEAALDGVKKEARETEVATERIGRSMVGVDRAAKPMNNSLRMASMQLSQVAQQGAATGNYLQALAIQAPDLALGFGAIGIAVGALIPVLYGVGSAFFNVTEEASILETQLSEMENIDLSSMRGAISSLEGVQRAYNEAIRDSGSASAAAANAVVANSRKEFEARKEILEVELALMRIRQQEQREQLRNLQASAQLQARSAREALENLSGFVPGQTPVTIAPTPFAARENALENIGFDRDLAAARRREIQRLEAEISLLEIGADEATEALNAVFDATGTVGVEGGGGGGRGQNTTASQRIAEAKDQLASLRAEIEVTQGVFDTIESSMSDAFMSMIDGTMSAKEAFRSMARDIIAELYRVLVVQQIVGQFNATSGQGSGILGFLGGAFMGTRAEGGPVRRGESYLVGERGPEIIRPASDGRVMANGSGGGVTINQTIQVTTGVQSTVRAEIMQMMPRIAEASKAAVMDARQRGGSFAGAF